MGFVFPSLIASSLQTSFHNAMLSIVSDGGGRRTLTEVTPELWTDFYLKLWHLCRQLIVKLQGCFTVCVLQEQLEQCSYQYDAAYLISASSSLMYLEAKIFPFVSLVLAKQLSYTKMKTRCRVQAALWMQHV